MSGETVFFIIILIINTLVAVVYLLVSSGVVHTRKKDRETGEKKRRGAQAATVIQFVVMLICPVVGPLVLLFSYLLYKTVIRQDVNLEDVIFSKERVSTHERADEEREMNMAPIEETIAVSDKESLRSLMLNVIKGDVHQSLAAISLALNSPDSESAHYAASVLQDELNNFRGNVQKALREIEDEDDETTECEERMIPYMNVMLEQRVFTELEQRNAVAQFESVASSLYRKAPYKMTSEYYQWVCLRLLDIKDFDGMEKWCDRAMEQYPHELSSYTCRLKLYFTKLDKEHFFAAMDDLKQSDIVVDRETLDLIRVFS